MLVRLARRNTLDALLMLVLRAGLTYRSAVLRAAGSPHTDY